MNWAEGKKRRKGVAHGKCELRPIWRTKKKEKGGENRAKEVELG